MSTAAKMLERHPAAAEPRGELVAAIEAMLECSQACTTCADACLAEEQIQQLTRCIRLNLDCADACATAARAVSRSVARDSSAWRSIVAACGEACRLCAEECEQHAEMGMEHCRVCGEACRRCEDACRTLLGAAPA